MPLNLDFLDEARETREDAQLDRALAAPVVSTPVAPPPLPSEVEIPAVLQQSRSFLCGSAGTGKTFMARGIHAQEKGCIIAATTGIASVNLGEGTTINALLGYFDTASLRESYTSGFLSARLGKLWRSGVRRVLLDEVSMMDGEQLTIISRALDELAGRGYVMDAQIEDEIEESGEVENGDPIKLTLIGDFAQLPPVKAPFAFESPEWPSYVAHTHTLTKIHRQADVDFIGALQAARRGDSDGVIHYFRQRLVSATQQNFDGVTIMATNEAVDRYNRLRMDAVPAAPTEFLSQRWGVTRGDWKNIPEKLTLKVGALVMILANERTPPIDGDPTSSRLIYANGDLGTIAAIDPDAAKVFVTLKRNGRTEEIQWVCRQNTLPLEPGDRKRMVAEGNAHLIIPERKAKVVGEVVYLPLRVAYASTVHKSQGLSLDTVQVTLREHFFKTPGMLYVALSRARTSQGLRLVGTIDGLRERCTVHAKVRPWL